VNHGAQKVLALQDPEELFSVLQTGPCPYKHRLSH